MDLAVAELEKAKYKDIIILTCSTLEKSLVASEVTDEMYRGKYPFTTCRKFKGLEKDAVILVDVDEQIFLNEKKKLLFYVGASRARLRLSIVASMDEKECGNVVKELFHECAYQKPRQKLARKLNIEDILG